MSTLRGVAVVTGAGGLVFTIAATGAPAAVSQIPQNHTIDRDADIKYLKDGSGDSKSAFITDRKSRITFEGTLYSTTVALARAEVDKVLVAPGATVGFADADLVLPDTAPHSASPDNGANTSALYLLESSKVARTNDGFLMATIVCVRFDDNDLTLQPT